MGKGVVYKTTLIAWSGFNPQPVRIIVSLDKTFYDDYLFLAASNKQQIQWTRIRWTIGSSKTSERCGFVEARSIVAMKTERDQTFISVWRYPVTEDQKDQYATTVSIAAKITFKY